MIYTLSLHDALPICNARAVVRARCGQDIAWPSPSSILDNNGQVEPPGQRARGVLGPRLERYLGGAAKTRVGLDAIERESERRGRELVRLALQAHLDARGDGDVGPALVIGGPSGRLRLAERRHHTRRLLTVFGEVSVTRLGYDTPGHQSIPPLDAELGLPGRTYSYEICRRLARAAVVGPFDEATALIAEMTGVVVPKRVAATTVIEAAVDFEI